MVRLLTVFIKELNKFAETFILIMRIALIKKNSLVMENNLFSTAVHELGHALGVYPPMKKFQ